MFPRIVTRGLIGVVVLAVLPLVLGAYYYCTHQELDGKTCEKPGKCINACAAKCSSLTSCRQCCQGFQPDPNAYAGCYNACQDVWCPCPQPDPNSVPNP